MSGWFLAFRGMACRHHLTLWTQEGYECEGVFFMESGTWDLILKLQASRQLICFSQLPTREILFSLSFFWTPCFLTSISHRDFIPVTPPAWSLTYGSEAAVEDTPSWSQPVSVQVSAGSHQSHMPLGESLHL